MVDTFDAWAREGIVDAARHYREAVAKLTVAIEAAGSPADAGVLIRELMELSRRDHPLDRWVELLPEVEGRCVRYHGEGASLTISVEDVPPVEDDGEIPF